MRHLFIIYLGLILITSCNQSENNTNNVKDSDTIKVNFNKSNKYPELVNAYYSRFGIVIPRYYIVDDSLSIDLNSDGIIDTLAILSPIALVDSKYYDSNIESTPKRLLVEIVYKDRKPNVRNIYSNLLSNIGGVLSKYSGISRTEKGFEITHESGSKYSWTYSTEFTNNSSDSLRLFKIKKTCSFENRDKSLEYSFNNMSVKNINIQDTIQNNCNCDPIWKMLEGEEK